MTLDKEMKIIISDRNEEEFADLEKDSHIILDYFGFGEEKERGVSTVKERWQSVFT